MQPRLTHDAPCPRRLLALALLLSTTGCFTTGYLAQAAGGQYDLIHRAQPLESVISAPSTPPRLRALLSKVPAIKRFGRLHGLTPTANYRDFVQLPRRAAVYVVQGCAPLAFEPRRWSFPIVGSVPYLGFFDEAAARAYAQQLAHDEPLDVTVRSASAYSTLGWFHDAVLSTMVPEGPEAFGALANTILHESVHATVYVPGQSAFDESLASFLADELTEELVLGRAREHPEEAAAWKAGEARSERFLSELRRAHDDLDTLYRSDSSDDEKRAKKAIRLAQLQAALKLPRPYNNADLAGVRTYDTGHDAFGRLRRACGTWPRLLAALRSLTPEDFGLPQQPEFSPVIDVLAQRACGEPRP